MDKKIKHPFTTSDSYFEELKENILEQAPGHLLEKYSKKNIYTVPENFFEEQYNQILNKKKSQEHHLFPALTSKRTLAWIGSSITTILVIIFSYSYFGTKEINDILSKESSIIQSDVTDMEDKLTSPEHLSQTSIVNPPPQRVLQEEIIDELILESSAL
ncbi:MAG TPA: hypothetical protein VK750_06430 [Cytophagaceae bacterium]|jgi:hypothetical protein|nr:hypothetical protein [Cytophagaceae bacterium]